MATTATAIAPPKGNAGHNNAFPLLSNRDKKL